MQAGAYNTKEKMARWSSRLEMRNVLPPILLGGDGRGASRKMLHSLLNFVEEPPTPHHTVVMVLLLPSERVEDHVAAYDFVFSSFFFYFHFWAAHGKIALLNKIYQRGSSGFRGK